MVLHAAQHSLSPWSPVWHEVTVVEAPPGNLPAIDGRIYTKVSGNLLIFGCFIWADILN